MDILPNVWGDGILFAFAGMDGQTSWSHPMVGSTQSDPPGLWFPTYGVTLHFGAGARVGEVRVAGNGVLDLDLIDAQGRTVALQMAFLDCRTLVGRCQPPLAPILDGPENHTMGLCTCLRAGRLDFALALYTGGREIAEQHAARVAEADIDQTLKQRMAFWQGLPPCPGAGERDLGRLYGKACSVLAVNTMTPEGQIAHRWTTPDRWPHRHMWLWDSAFHAPAYAHLDPAWGRDALLAVLGMQRDDGFIAHTMTPVHTSKITQPPILAWSCWEVHQIDEDLSFLEQAYPALCRYLEWDLRRREWNGNGLLGWLIEGEPLCRSGESGMDNSPRFDCGGPWDSIDMNAYAVHDMRCVAQIARALGREPEAVQWDGRAGALSERVNRLLWDDESGFYYDRELDGDLLRIKGNAGFLPLLAGIPSPEQAERLVAHLTDPSEFWPSLPVPTIALDEPSHEPDMWRGPTWININRLITLGLERYGYVDVAQELRRRTLAEIDRWYRSFGCLYEYYDCRGEIAPPLLHRKGAPGRAGGTGFGVIADYNWTAACTALMLWEAS